ncbi:MAG: acyclic terpene utilization AtuA family protein [Saprospiraceae bacterium]
MNNNKNKVIIANMSGFYGDRFSAAKEMVEGGPIDYLTGDYLAELTMAILYKAKVKRPETGYAVSFLKQMEGIMGTCLDKSIRVIVNAGGLNPSGLAAALKSVAKLLKVHPSIAYIEGDDLMPRLSDLQKAGASLKHLEKNTTLAESNMTPISANAYLGCWGIVQALSQGADIVVTGRVSDTSVVMGPAAYHFGWSKDNWDALAGAAVVGHIIECGGQATGGNYSFFDEVPSFDNIGFPIAELHSDGSAVITKHPGTGGLVSTGTITAQLLYEINAPQYITPDVVAHFDTINLSDDGLDRVKVSETKGSPATDTAKVTINCVAGYQNNMTFHLIGMDVERKAEILKQSFIKNVGGENAFDKLDIKLFKNDTDELKSIEEGFSTMRISVTDKDANKAGKFFTSKLIELALCTVPGWCMGSPPRPARPRIVHFPALIEKKYLTQKINVDGNETLLNEMPANTKPNPISKPIDYNITTSVLGPIQTARLGEIYAARSGDKGGNANVGIWGKTDKSYAFLSEYLTVKKIKTLLPDTAPFEIIRYEFPNLKGLNFYIKGYLEDGVAASTKMDAQAKTLGEYLRFQKMEIPVDLLI